MHDYNKFRKTLRATSEVGLRNLTLMIGWDNGKSPGETVDPGHAMFLWLNEKLSSLATETAHLLLYTYRNNIIKYGRELEKVRTNTAVDKYPVAQLVIADNQYAACTGTDVFLNIRTGEKLGGLKRAACVATSYNLCEIYMRGIERMSKSDEGE